MWPPTWVRTTKDGIKTITGEVGILIYVHSNPTLSDKCFVVMEHERESYVGTLTFENHAFTRQFCDLLGLNFKRSIKEIGDLDLSYIL